MPSSAKVKVFPIVERYKWLWIWMGEPELADPAASMRIERKEVGAPGEFDHLSDEELLQALRERFVQLERDLH